MKKSLVALVILSLMFVYGCDSTPKDKKSDEPKDEYFGNPPKKGDTLDVDVKFPEEKHFAWVRQLTFGGNNAEAYFSTDGQKFVFQSDYAKWGVHCDQIFWWKLSDGVMRDTIPHPISMNKGRTTCSYFLPGDTTVLFASTMSDGYELKDNYDCPPLPAHRKDHKYVWPLYNTYDIFVSDLQGKIKKRLTNTLGYDAEATVSPKGDKIVFTSTRSGDLELWTMNIDGTNLKQVTKQLGYDGGANFSPDGTKLVFRASRPKGDDKIKEYNELLSQGLVMPTELEIFTCNVDGTDLKQITHLGKANWAPCFHPSGNKILFASNHAGTKGFNFNLYLINTDGTGLEKVTNDAVFDAFPMFSPNGKYILFSSNRNNKGTHDTNLFLAKWEE